MQILEKEELNPPIKRSSVLSTQASNALAPPVSFQHWFKLTLHGLIACLLMLSLAESLARFIVVLAKPTISHTTSFDRKFALARQGLKSSSTSTLAILGDSLIDFALYSEQLTTTLKQAGLNTDVVNLAVPGNTYEQDLLLLKTAVQNGHKPRLVITHTHLRLFNRSFYKTQSQTNHQFESSYLDRCLSSKPKKGMPQLRCALEKNFYLLRYRDFFKTELDQLQTTLMNPKKRLEFQPAQAAEQDFSPGGWTPAYAMSTDADFQTQFALTNKSHYRHIQNDFDQFNWTESHFETLRQYCLQEHIPMLVLWLPEHPISNAYYEHFHIPLPALTEHYQHYFDQHHVRFINLRNRLSTTQGFTDPEHFNPLGTQIITQTVGDILLKEARPLWLSKPEAHKP